MVFAIITMCIGIFLTTFLVSYVYNINPMLAETLFFVIGVVISFILIFIAFYKDDNKRLSISDIGNILLYSGFSWISGMIVFGYIIESERAYREMVKEREKHNN